MAGSFHFNTCQTMAVNFFSLASSINLSNNQVGKIGSAMLSKILINNQSIIDLNLNNGLGKVTQKNVLLDSSPICDGMVAVKHGNGRDWWLIYKRVSNSNIFNKILITDQGIQPSTQHAIGNNINSNGNINGNNHNN